MTGSIIFLFNYRQGTSLKMQ